MPVSPPARGAMLIRDIRSSSLKKEVIEANAKATGAGANDAWISLDELDEAISRTGSSQLRVLKRFMKREPISAVENRIWGDMWLEAPYGDVVGFSKGSG